ncbi:MAG: hypothetical protein QOH97_3088, partial [Actinoplanes sp.]|nr:hypothetical protein [Actinoplanes sp.]
AEGQDPAELDADDGYPVDGGTSRSPVPRSPVDGDKGAVSRAALAFAAVAHEAGSYEGVNRWDGSWATRWYSEKR